MSRYSIPTGRNDREYVVGFDPPLQTYFFQVFDPTLPEDENECIFWVGDTYDALPTLGDLVLVVREQTGVVIPRTTLKALREDKVMSGPPSPLQQQIRRLYEEGRSHACNGTDPS